MVSQASAGLWLHFFKADVIQIPLYYTTLQAGGNTRGLQSKTLNFLPAYIFHIILYKLYNFIFLILYKLSNSFITETYAANTENIISFFRTFCKSVFRSWPLNLYCCLPAVQNFQAVYRHRAHSTTSPLYWKLHILAVNICVNATLSLNERLIRADFCISQHSAGYRNLSFTISVEVKHLKDISSETCCSEATCGQPSRLGHLKSRISMSYRFGLRQKPNTCLPPL